MRGTLDQFRVLVSVAECGSFTAAAAQRNVEVSAVSRAVRELETEIGMPLFDRLARGVRLTVAGRSLVVSARDILERVNQARLDARRAGTGRDRQLALGFVWSATCRPLVELLKEFASEYPSIAVDLVEDGGDELIGRLRSERLDVAITATDPPPFERLREVSPLRSFPLWIEPLAVLVPGGASVEQVTWEEISRHRLLCRTLDDWPRFAQHVRRAGGPSLTFETHTVSQEGILGLVAAGFGWAVLPRNLVHAPLDGLDVLSIESLGAQLQVEALWCEDNSNPALTRFLALCRRLYHGRGDHAEPSQTRDQSP